MKAELAIYVNFTRLWKSCAYCKGKVHLTTLTSENYTNEEHTEWKLPVIEIDNEKWQMLGWVVAKKKKGFYQFSSPPGIRPQTLRFHVPVLYNGSHITENSMVLSLDGLI